jgi:hypothetical protein
MGMGYAILEGLVVISGSGREALWFLCSDALSEAFWSFLCFV